jgi:NADH-quinone oxidoreductase subunit F
MPESDRVLSSTVISTLEEHLRQGGGHGLAAARHRTPTSIIDLVERAGLRGRGGAGFPTGRKWRTVAALGPVPTVVNAAEGEPGTFKDRLLIRRNPYLVLEGAIIAARAVSSTELIISTKRSFTHELELLARAIREVEAAGWIDGLDVRIVEGPSEYLFGEETALLEVVDGRPPFPRVKAPYRRGVLDEPEAPYRDHREDGPGALVDNVETFANVPGILRHGADWYRSVGTSSSPGTIVCTVTGDVARSAVGEFELGSTVREVIDRLGGGTSDGRSIATVLLGVSNPPLSPDQLDTPLTYEDMSAIGSGLGSASFIVVDDATPLTSVAGGVARFLAVESCGQCEPCKRDSIAIATAYRDGAFTGISVSDRLDTVGRGARCALAAQTERVVGRLLAMGATPPSGGGIAPVLLVAPLVDIVDGRAILDSSHVDKQFDWSYATDGPDSGKWPAQLLENQPVVIRAAHVPEPPNRVQSRQAEMTCVTT